MTVSVEWEKERRRDGWERRENVEIGEPPAECATYVLSAM